MWKFSPDSTEGKGSGPVSYEGGVRAFCSGDAWYDWNSVVEASGGREARCGFRGGDGGTC